MAPVERESTTDLPTPDVLTLPEAAAYLRVSEDVLLQMANEQAIPGRRVGEEWRFLKSALQDWLRCWGVPSDRTVFHFLATHGKFPPWDWMLIEFERRFKELEERLLLKLKPPEQPQPERGSRERILALAGAWRGDPYRDELLRGIYEQRGRPMVEEGE
jgi:excisionase family DNA binding protein